MATAGVSVPVTFSIAKWYGYLFSATFILYGGVTILLGFLDRNYSDFAVALIFLMIGIIFLSFCFAFKSTYRWGWYALVAMNTVVLLLSIVALGRHPLNIALLVLSLGALAALLAPSTRSQFFPVSG